MDLIPEHRAVFGVDVVGAGRNQGAHLGAVFDAVATMVPESLRSVGIDRAEVLTWENTGDGILATLPSRRLGSLVDLSHHLDALVADHNQWRKPDVRMRIAIDVGPIDEAPSLYLTKIEHERMLNADKFKDLFTRCVETSDGGVNTALIISDHALRSVFGGSYASVVRRSDFAPLAVTRKGFAANTWVRVPGLDANTVTRLTEHEEPEPAQEGGFTVVNRVNGAMHGVQAGVINGGLTFGTPK